MRVAVVVVNDFFFSAVGFYLGTWYYKLLERRKLRRAHD